MPYILCAFVFGLFIPYMARRFAKFMPATFAGAIVELFKAGKKVRGYRRLKLYKKLLWRSLMSGLLCGGTVWLAYVHFGSYGLSFMCAYICILLLLAEIDCRTFLLPDILTFPLLLLGILASGLNMGLVSPLESSFGAVVGYVLPVVVSLLIVWYKKDAFGGGDIKLLSAIGAWLGVEGLLYVIAFSSVLGLLYALVRRQRALAFGPMIALAAIVVAICLF